jgi:hypothetical protein
MDLKQLMWQVLSVGAWEEIDIDWSESLFQQIPHPSPHMEQPVWSKALLTNQLDACWYWGETEATLQT